MVNFYRGKVRFKLFGKDFEDGCKTGKKFKYDTGKAKGPSFNEQRNDCANRRTCLMLTLHIFDRARRTYWRNITQLQNKFGIKLDANERLVQIW